MDEVLILIILCVLVGTLFAYLCLVIIPADEKHMEDIIKLINSMSCKDIGQYLVDNALNYTWSDSSKHLYQYAQTKYLVCTHSLPGGNR